MARHKQPHLSLSKARSSITNGRHLLPEVDARSAWMRRYKDLIAEHTSDLGGDDLVSESERRLIRRAATLTIWCEMYDARFAANNGEVSQNGIETIETYQRCVNTLRRTLESLGLSRRSRDVNVPLRERLARGIVEGEVAG